MKSNNPSDSRYIIGIDLGTTSIEVSYVDTQAGREIHPFRVLQLVAPGETSERGTLPSFCYLAGEHDLPAGALNLPWAKDGRRAVGHFARDQGTKVPGRLVASAKSWLAHPGVDREAPILPWGGELGEEAVSPVTVSRLYLEHVKEAWNQRFGTERDDDGTPCALAEQQVVLTVPASFDEVARELTVRAAKQAGLERLVLLEEPLAAFYSWLQRHESDWRSRLKEGDAVLVVDIGGGTTDFSVVEVEADFHIRRTAVGEHLLLGGDNIDMALAREIETHWKTRLGADPWSQLCQLCRQAKEHLLSVDDVDQVPIILVGSGSSVIGGTRKASLTRAHLEQVLLEGFFPEVNADGPGPARRSGMREMGLPYASDPAITRHLLSFLRYAHRARATDPKQVDAKAPLKPTQVLFNGGALLPGILRRQLSAILGRWAGTDGPLPELESMDLRHAVAHGAAYYGLVRRGAGQRVRGGIARSYYIEVQRNERTELVCVMPRDKDEGDVVVLDQHAFQLTANQAVRFPLCCSSTRLGDGAGQILKDRDEITPLPALHTVLQYGKQAKRILLEVQVGAVLNEVGTLDLWCATTDNQHRYPLSFDLRSTLGAENEEKGEVEVIVAEARLGEAARLLREAFEEEVQLAGVVRELEAALHLRRAQWGASLLRFLGDVLLEMREVRLRSPEHEKRWLNLTGFCLRPGYGAPGDELRVRECWKLWHEGCRFDTRNAVQAEWWVAWRRLAGGLRAGHHEQIYNALRRLMQDPKTKLPAPQPRESQTTVEMWRCLGALERLNPSLKIKLLKPFLEAARPWKDHHYWAVARLGARRLLYGPANMVIPAAHLESLLGPFFRQVEGSTVQHVSLALASLCRRTGVRDLDLDQTRRQEALRLLKGLPESGRWEQTLLEVQEVTRQTQSELAGDRLPLGLTLAGMVEEAEA